MSRLRLGSVDRMPSLPVVERILRHFIEGLQTLLPLVSAKAGLS